MAWSWNPLTNFNAFGTGGSSGNKSQAPSYQYQPFSGVRPPRVDYTDPSTGQPTNYLRSTQALTQKIIPERAQGIGVGYDPAWMTESTNLLKDTLNRNAEDQTRAAAGSLSAAGLSGNPRAIEATQGRVLRDVGRTYGQGVTQLDIANMERANQERDVNTARLQQLNSSNFGQENNAANFDLSVYGAEQGNQKSAAQMAANNYWDQAALNNQNATDVGQLASSALMLAMPQTAPFIAGGNVMNQTGTGITPNSYMATPGFYNQPLNSKTALTNLYR